MKISSKIIYNPKFTGKYHTFTDFLFKQEIMMDNFVTNFLPFETIVTGIIFPSVQKLKVIKE